MNNNSNQILKQIMFIRNTEIKYYIETECISLRRSIINYFFYSNFKIYENIIQQSIYIWSSIYKNHIINSNTPYNANIIFKIDSLNNTTLGLCQNSFKYPNSIYKSIIKINKNKCYHDNRLTCNIINRMNFLNISIPTAIIIFCLLCLSNFILILYSNKICKNNKNNKNILYYYFYFYFVFMFIYWYDIRSCIDCYDLSKIILHELGHAFGLNHSNTSEYSIMTSTYNINVDSCIFQADLELYNKLYSTNFNKSRCYALDSNIFFLENILIILFLYFIFITTTICIYNKIFKFFKNRVIIHPT